MRGFASGTQSLVHALAANWWLILARGLCAIAFGLFALVWPAMTLTTLVLLFAAFALIDGLFALVAAIGGEAPESRWWLAISGIVGIAAGALAFAWPAITALTLLVFIGCWAIIIGALQIFGAIQLRKHIDNEWRLIAAGALSILVGVILLARPGAGALGLIYVIGAYALAHGVLLITLAFRLRRHIRA